MAKLYVGLSGYSYKPWQGEGRFYPSELKQKDFFQYYSERYNAVEMDGTWYRMPSESAVQGWLAASPDGFMFTFKAHRSISHVQRLKPDCLDSIKFQSDRLKPLRDAGKLAAIFVQLPPNFKRNDPRLKGFLETLPPGFPWAIEFRNESWHCPETEAMMREHNVSWVSWNTDELAGERRDTGSFIYSRMRRSAYTDEQLGIWRDWFKSNLDKGKDCFVFFKHEDEGSPWIDANRLLEMF